MVKVSDRCLAEYTREILYIIWERVSQLECGLLRTLREAYRLAGSPYGDDEEGFERWMSESWDIAEDDSEEDYSQN